MQRVPNRPTYPMAMSVFVLMSTDYRRNCFEYEVAFNCVGLSKMSLKAYCFIKAKIGATIA